MDKWMQHLVMTFEGQRHRALDDARNAARICLLMVKDGVVLRCTDEIRPQLQNSPLSAKPKSCKYQNLL